MIKLDIFWKDLTAEKQNEIIKILGNDHNYDTFPLATLEFDVPLSIIKYDSDALKYLDCEFYSIMYDYVLRIKVIRIWGYVYSTDKDVLHPYRSLEYTWFAMPLGKFLAVGFDYDTAQIEQKKHIDDASEATAIEILGNYYRYRDTESSSNAVELPFKDIAMDTPCGDYVNYNKRRTK